MLIAWSKLLASVCFQDVKTTVLLPYFKKVQVLNLTELDLLLI